MKCIDELRLPHGPLWPRRIDGALTGRSTRAAGRPPALHVPSIRYDHPTSQPTGGAPRPPPAAGAENARPRSRPIGSSDPSACNTPRPRFGFPSGPGSSPPRGGRTGRFSNGSLTALSLSLHTPGRRGLLAPTRPKTCAARCMGHGHSHAIRHAKTPQTACCASLASTLALPSRTKASPLASKLSVQT